VSVVDGGVPPGRLLGLRFACLAAGFLVLIGCGRASSDPDSGGPRASGGTVASGDGGSGEVGGANEPQGGAGGSGDEPQGGVVGGISSGNGGGGGSDRGGQGTAGGDPSLAGLPLPPGCEPVRGAETDFSCSLEIACMARSESIECYETLGSWQCSCASPQNLIYRVAGAAGFEACAVGAGLCSGSPPAIDPEGCVVAKEELGTEVKTGLGAFNTCTVEMSCKTLADTDFAPGASATVGRSAAIRCLAPVLEPPPSGPMRMSCEVTRTGGSETYAVVADDVAEACRQVLDFSLRAKEAEYEGPESCVQEGGPVDSRSCHLIERCFDGEPLSNGVSLVKDPLSREVFCGLDDLGTLGCSCSLESTTGDGAAPQRDSFSVYYGPSAPPTTCDFSDCTPGIRAEATGPGECQTQLYTGQHDDDSCTDSFYCSQPATLNGQAVTIGSWLKASCQRAPDESFYCACGSGVETASFSVGVVPSSADACSMARTGCLEHVSLPLGPTPVVPPSLPDPLPASGS
jgi:hypothetical protein